MTEPGEPSDSSTSADGIRVQFGNRFLTDKDDVFAHNAWDNVEWNEEQEQAAVAKVAANSAKKVASEEFVRLQQDAPKNWDSFYDTHANRFFKDRHWLMTEFPELLEPGAEGRRIFELGCGVGNTIMPLLSLSADPQLRVYGCDFSGTAIDILRENLAEERQRCEVFVMDATDPEWQVPFAENSLDVIVAIFVLSAIKPSQLPAVAANCYRYLKPGGLLLFRDYGRYDLAQLRFKSGKCVEDNFYVRGDGTFVYFFTNEEVHELFCGAGFEEVQNLTDKRLQVNRSRMLTMHRIWMQGKFQKPK